MARRITNHSGRTHKSGKNKGKVFSARHADRNFNTGRDKHIDPSLSHLNTYWTNPDLGITAKTFDEFEQKFYESRFAEHIAATNEKHEKTRHYERMIDARSLRNNSRTCVEDTLLYFGDKDNPLPDKERDEIVAEFIAWHQEKFPQCVILDYATHRDEPLSATHTEVRSCWCAVHEDGYLYPNQTKALEQMGHKNKGQKRDNAKMEYTRLCREKQAEILMAHGYAVELTPKHDKGGQKLEEFKRDKAIEERQEQEKFILSPEEVKKAETEIRPNKFNKDEVVMPKEIARKLVVTSLERDRYKKEYETTRDYKDKSIDQEKMELRIQLNRERENHQETKNKLREITDFTKEFLVERGMLQAFQKLLQLYRDEKAFKQKLFQERQERLRQQEQEHTHHRRR